MTLSEVLAAREARAALQASLASRWRSPVLSMTLVSPGPVKDGPGHRKAMGAAQAALAAALGRAGLRLVDGVRSDGPAGPEYVAAVLGVARGEAARPAETLAAELKRLAVELEETLPWGRILDIDVIAFAPGAAFPEPLSREVLGLAPRRCLVCEKPARECMADRSHALDELAAASGMILDSIP